MLMLNYFMRLVDVCNVGTELCYATVESFHEARSLFGLDGICCRFIVFLQVRWFKAGLIGSNAGVYKLM